MSWRISFKSIGDFVSHGANMQVECACGRKGVLDAKKVARWYSAHFWNAARGQQGGYVMPHIVRAALVDVIATVDQNCGIGNTRTERKQNSDCIAKRYESMIRSIAESGVMKDWPEAQLVKDRAGLN
ncbi:hypothetical protein P1X14_11155 [Sphingomonas sp. AOB5]|uniref:hypothetical protein n=1 Tax=Sphingomonas sp. AOB5 TaxID=3034017 RepID=UPI0023F62142|nr:hypothetical protein [Sphingomonas sp. AOB5]MDF7775805.1 hypothetical protein [Sphingomonas sp. AOB5]